MERVYILQVLIVLIWLALWAMSIAGLWMIFVKAGRQGWESLLPFYNLFVLFQILYGEGTKVFLLLIPFYNIYIAIRLWVDLAQFFGKSVGFAVGLLLMNPVFLLILGLDKGTSAPSRPNPAPPTAPSTLYVSIQFGSLAGAAFPITANGATIGRDPSCMICLPANTPGVNRQHCRVTLSGSSLTLTDLNSSNGTFFRGTRLSPYVPTTLNRGDTFALGGSGNILQVI